MCGRDAVDPSLEISIWVTARAEWIAFRLDIQEVAKLNRKTQFNTKRRTTTSFML
jgi:hypothetical protein